MLSRQTVQRAMNCPMHLDYLRLSMRSLATATKDARVVKLRMIGSRSFVLLRWTINWDLSGLIVSCRLHKESIPVSDLVLIQHSNSGRAERPL